MSWLATGLVLTTLPVGLALAGEPTVTAVQVAVASRAFAARGILFVEAGLLLLVVGLVSSVAGDRLVIACSDWSRSVDLARQPAG